MEITPDSEVLRLEKRQRGLQRVATAINDLTIYGIYPTNFPKLVLNWTSTSKVGVITYCKRVYTWLR